MSVEMIGWLSIAGYAVKLSFGTQLSWLLACFWFTRLFTLFILFLFFKKNTTLNDDPTVLCSKNGKHPRVLHLSTKWF